MEAQQAHLTPAAWRKQFQPGLHVFIVSMPTYQQCTDNGEYDDYMAGCGSPTLDPEQFMFEEWIVNDFPPDMIVVYPLRSERKWDVDLFQHRKAPKGFKPYPAYAEQMARIQKQAMDSRRLLEMKKATAENKRIVAWADAWAKVSEQDYNNYNYCRRQTFHKYSFNQHYRIFFSKQEAKDWVILESMNQFHAYKEAMEGMVLDKNVQLLRIIQEKMK
jgi:hypothetical protein